MYRVIDNDYTLRAIVNNKRLAARFAALVGGRVEVA